MGSQPKNMTLCTVLWETLQNFGDQTSIAGLGQAVQRKQIANKIYWFILFVIGSILTIEGMINTLNVYYQYSVSTNSEVTRKDSITFPAVSVCNLNRVHCTNLLMEIIKLQELMNKNTVENSSKEENNATLENLKNSFFTANCNTQVCDILESKIKSISGQEKAQIKNVCSKIPTGTDGNADGNDAIGGGIGAGGNNGTGGMGESIGAVGNNGTSGIGGSIGAGGTTGTDGNAGVGEAGGNNGICR